MNNQELLGWARKPRNKSTYHMWVKDSGGAHPLCSTRVHTTSIRRLNLTTSSNVEIGSKCKYCQWYITMRNRK